MRGRGSSGVASAVLLAAAGVVALVGWVAMLTFGAVANEFGAPDAPGYLPSLGIAAGLAVVTGSGFANKK